jgi:hypothetical protein
MGTRAVKTGRGFLMHSNVRLLKEAEIERKKRTSAAKAALQVQRLWHG